MTDHDRHVARCATELLRTLREHTGQWVLVTSDNPTPAVTIEEAVAWIREQGIRIDAHDTLLFFRARLP